MTDYARKVADSGGVPVLLPREADPRLLIERLDGLLIAGGQDVDPRRYGSSVGPRSTEIDPGRDAFEIALVRSAILAEIPVLGICRGMQLLNVALGGSIIADLPTGAGQSHGFCGYPPTERRHTVKLTTGSTVQRIYGSNDIAVNSYHHQAVDRPGEGLHIVGNASDGVVEAIEMQGRPVLGVQWHPEMLDGIDPVFSWLTRVSNTTNTRMERDHAVA